MTKLPKLLLISTVLVLTSCAVPIKEENFYTDKGPDGAVETHFYSTDVRDLSKDAWDSIREGMTCMSGQAIADIKGEIEKLCTKTPCSKQVQAAREQALLALDRMQRLTQTDL